MFKASLEVNEVEEGWMERQFFDEDAERDR
jgi:hypothetical protein